VCASDYAKDIVSRDAEENRASKILPREYAISYTKIIFGDNVAIISPHLIIRFYRWKWAFRQNRARAFWRIVEFAAGVRN